MKVPPIIKEHTGKLLFWTGAILLLLFMLFSSLDAGISGDEEVHYVQSVKVYNYFSTFGKDQSALNTPTTHLRYYGQLPDNLTTILIRWFNIQDIYTTRHLVSSLIGWATILITAFFAIWLSGYGAGILTLLLFALSPTFLGHAQNNLKDIPFALAYIAGTYLIIKWLFSDRRSKKILFLLVLSIAFCISIRAGGVLLFCYLLFFLCLYEWLQWRKIGIPDRSYLKERAVTVGIILIASYFLSILLWPYVLQNPISGFWESYKVMTQFPTTIQQIFEGRAEWSDFMPWYYLPKLMAITIPLLIWKGVIGFFLTSRKIAKDDRLKYFMLLFTIIFPIVFVIYEKSNLYGSWRHFLFIYPGIIVLSAIGWWNAFSYLKRWQGKLILSLLIVLLGFHPLSFMVRNHPYYYLYYNQLIGGLKGAYGNYETDYYYHSMREGSEWLINHLKEEKIADSVKIGTNFPADWFYRNTKNLTVKYIPYNERSNHDWDYFVVVNSYISPYLLKHSIWPPANAIKVIKADGVPICAVLKRTTKSDYLGSVALNQNKLEEACKFFEDAIKKEGQDEIIFYNFAAASFKQGDKDKTLKILRKGLEINPENESILMFQANILLEKGDTTAATQGYQRLISLNRKYFEAYVALAGIWINQGAYQKARNLLKTCLEIHPTYKEAIVGLANSYRKTNPEIAKKYDELANSYP